MGRIGKINRTFLVIWMNVDHILFAVYTSFENQHQQKNRTVPSRTIRFFEPYAGITSAFPDRRLQEQPDRFRTSGK